MNASLKCRMIFAIHCFIGVIVHSHGAWQIAPVAHTLDHGYFHDYLSANLSLTSSLAQLNGTTPHRSSLTVKPQAIVTDPDFNLNKTIPTIRHHKDPAANSGHGSGHGDDAHDEQEGHGHGGGHGGHGHNDISGELSHHQHKVWLAKSVVAPAVFVFMGVFAIISLMEYTHLSWLPEAAVIVLIGALLGWGMLNYTPPSLQKTVFGSLNSTLLNLFLLPPLIFETGWTVRRRDFASQFNYIMLFSVIGVAISACVIAMIINMTGNLGLHPAVTMRTAFTYAALISATDPVATLATYTELQVEPLLYTMVFGESCLNDGVAIVLFNAFNNDEIMATVNTPGVFMGKILFEVVNIFIGSALVGLFVAFGFILVLRFTGMRRSPKLEILYIAASPYLTFAVTEAMGYSGIISVLMCAFAMGMYARPHLSTEGALLATFFIKQAATINDIAVFLFVGVSVVQISTQGLELAFAMIFACIIGRYAAVYPLGWTVNVMKIWHGKAHKQNQEDWHLLTNRHLFMMGHAGLRGAISLVMAMEIGDWVERDNGPGTRQMLVNVTFFIICTFLFLFGGTTEKCLRMCNISMGKPTPPDYLYKAEVDGWFRVWTGALHQRVLVPVLVGEARLAAHIEESEQEVDVESALACGRGVTGVPFTPRIAGGSGSRGGSPRSRDTV